MPSILVTAEAAASRRQGVNWNWKLLLQATIVLAMLADFVFRGLAIAFLPDKTDFTELYTSAWLWRHGQNFYDSALVTSTATRLTGCREGIAPVYPPTTVGATSLFTFLSWGWAHWLWLVLSLVGVGVTIWLLLRLGNFDIHGAQARLLITLVIAFSPLHQAFHLANIAPIVVPLCLAGILLGERRQDVCAGAVLALATILKPQLGIWFLGYYLIQQRKKLVASAALTALPFGLVLYHYPVPAGILFASYRQNFQHWFGVGRPFGFTEGAFPFNVNYVQIVLFQLWHNVIAVKVLAHTIFAAGLAIWGVALVRLKFRAPVPLALSSLLGLSFVSMYHSVSDATILALVLCWALQKETRGDRWQRPKRTTCFIFCVMLLPGHSLLIRIAPHLPPHVANAWWWKLFVARYFVWLLVTFNGVLLYVLAKMAFQRAMGREHLQSSVGVPEDSVCADQSELQEVVPVFAQSD